MRVVNRVHHRRRYANLISLPRRNRRHIMPYATMLVNQIQIATNGPSMSNIHNLRNSRVQNPPPTHKQVRILLNRRNHLHTNQRSGGHHNRYRRNGRRTTAPGRNIQRSTHNGPPDQEHRRRHRRRKARSRNHRRTRHRSAARRRGNQRVDKTVRCHHHGTYRRPYTYAPERYSPGRRNRILGLNNPQ